MLFQLLTTPYVPATRNPRWESWVEFFVGDFSQVGFDIYLCDYIFFYWKIMWVCIKITSHDLLTLEFFQVAIKASSFTVYIIISAVETIQTSFNNLGLLLGSHWCWESLCVTVGMHTAPQHCALVRCMLRACLSRKFLTANVCSLVCIFQNTYSFFVYDWDGTNTIDDDFLGVAHLSLRKVRDLHPNFVACVTVGDIPLNPWTPCLEQWGGGGGGGMEILFSRPGKFWRKWHFSQGFGTLGDLMIMVNN